MVTSGTWTTAVLIVATIASASAVRAQAGAALADPFEERIGRLATCRPTSERRALHCLDQLLTDQEKRFILELDYDDLEPLHDEGWSAAIIYAWEEPYRPPPLRLYYRRYGFPVQGDWSMGATMLVSYWLKHHGCKLDHAKRAARDHSIQDALTADARYVRENPQMRGLTHPERDMVEFRPSCWTKAAR